MTKGEEGQEESTRGYPYPRISVNLGPEPLHSRRVATLDLLARRYSVTRSKLFQMIGDGELTVVPSPFADEREGAEVTACPLRL